MIQIMREYYKLVIFCLGLLLVCLTSCEPTENDETDDPGVMSQTDFPDILKVKGIPSDPLDLSVYSFSDLGAWHSFALPGDEDKEYYGSVIGPFLMTQANGVWQGRNLLKLSLTDLETNQSLDLAESGVVNINYLPGKLTQRYHMEDLEVSLELIFISSRSALIQSTVSNIGEEDRDLEIGWSGASWIEGSNLSSEPGVIITSFEESAERSVLQFDRAADIEISDTIYKIKSYRYGLSPGESLSHQITHSVIFNDLEWESEIKKGQQAMEKPQPEFEANAKRWNGYLEAILTNHQSEWADWEHREVLAVKALETLVNNWRTAAGELRYDGLFPSYAYRGFHGFWSWDSWKHAVALVQFNPELAKNQVRTMFDYQNDQGMIADCIFRDTTIEAHNWRDTKPPLATWAVMEIYDRTEDLEFVREMYPKLVKYHKWWYQFRDFDKNGLCEFGSTDGTKEAAMWESGMDNAVRFDHAVMVGSNDGGWSMDQESVDLNAFLYKEKVDLSRLAELIGKGEDSKEFLREAEELKEIIKSRFYDETSGYFYDRNFKGELISVMGPEAWIPLWSRVADTSQATEVKRRLVNEKYFNTRLPFPTFDASRPEFEPAKGYWRGPVWIDQAYFALEGMKNYGFQEEANTLALKLFENAKGLTEKGQPIYENYNPLNGEPLNAPHFSWSAAHILMILNE